MKSCLFILIVSLVSLVQSRGVKLGLPRVQAPLSVENGNYFTWESCSSDNSRVVINTMDITLNGLVAALDIDVTLKEEVSNGTVYLSVSNGYFNLSKTLSLCYLVKMAKESCPISAEDYKLTTEYTLPSFLCGSSYTGEVSVVNGNKDLLGCITFKMKLNCS